MDTHRRCVLSCPAIATLVLRILNIGGLQLGEPNELDAIHLAAGY